MSSVYTLSPRPSRSPSPASSGPPAYEAGTDSSTQDLVTARGTTHAPPPCNPALRAPGLSPRNSPPPHAAPPPAPEAPYVGAIELGVFNEGPHGVLPGLPQAGTKSRARRLSDWFFRSTAARPATGNWALNLLDRRIEIRKSPAYFAGQVALLAWDAATSNGSGRTASSVVAAFTQLAPTLLLHLCGPQLHNAERVVEGTFDVLNVFTYPVGTPLAIGALAVLEAGEPRIKNFIEYTLGRTDSARVVKNVMQVAATLGCMAFGREIEHVSTVHNWYYNLARQFISTPSDGCQMWLDPKAGVSLFVNCVDTSNGPSTLAISCGSALGSCAAAAFGSLNRTRSLPPASMALSPLALADALENIVQRNSSQIAMTASVVRLIADQQTNGNVASNNQAQATSMVESLMGSSYLAALANDTSIPDGDFAATLAATAIRFSGGVVSWNEWGSNLGSTGYDALQNMYGAVGYRESIKNAFGRMSQNESLTQTLTNGGEYDVAVDSQGAGSVDIGILWSASELPGSCQPAIGNLALQFAGGRVDGKRPANLPPIANLSAFGYDPSVYFQSCDIGTERQNALPDNSNEPLRALAQVVTNNWAAPTIYVGGCQADSDWNNCPPTTLLTVPPTWDAWRNNLTTALKAKNATDDQAQAIAVSWDKLRDYVAAMFGDNTPAASKG